MSIIFARPQKSNKSWISWKHQLFSFWIWYWMCPGKSKEKLNIYVHIGIITEKTQKILERKFNSLQISLLWYLLLQNQFQPFVYFMHLSDYCNDTTTWAVWIPRSKRSYDCLLLVPFENTFRLPKGFRSFSNPFIMVL